MADLGDMVVRIVGDNSQLDRSIDNSRQKMQKFADNMVNVGRQLSTFVTLPILAIGTAFVKAASDAEETNSKFDAVFKNQKDEVRAWAGEFSEAVGRSTTQNIGFLATIQDTLVPLGFLRDRAADMSKATVTLATDLASFNNLPTKQVIMDIQSALVGNTETLRKYGVVASQEAIIQEALNSGLIDNKNDLDAASKAQAIYNILLASTTDAQGDAIRTAESTANQFKALKAETIDLAIAFGQQLIPFVNNMIDKARVLVDWFTNLEDSTKQTIVRIAGLAAVLGPLALAIGTVQKALLALSAPPTGAIVVAVIAIVAITNAIIQLIKRQRELRTSVDLTTQALRDMSEQERQAEREDLVKLRDRQTEAIRGFNSSLRDLKPVFNEYGMQINDTSQQELVLRDAIAEAGRQMDIHQGAITRIDRLTVEYNQTLADAVVATDEATESAGDFLEELNDLADGIDDVGTASKTTAADIALLRAEMEEDETGAGAGRANVAARIRAELELRRLAAVEQLAIANALREDEVVGYAQSTAGFVAMINARKEAVVEEAEQLLDIQAGRLLNELAADEAHNAALVEIARVSQEEIDAIRDAAAEAEKQRRQDIVDGWVGATSALVGLSQALLDRRVANLVAQGVSEEDAAEQTIQAQIRVARFRKVAEAFATGIAAIRATIEALPNLVLSVATAVAGAAAVAAILATPIPSATGAGTAPTAPPVVGTGGSVATGGQRPGLDDVSGSLVTGGQRPPAGEGTLDLTINLDSEPILRSVTKGARDGRVLIDARAVV